MLLNTEQQNRLLQEIQNLGIAELKTVQSLDRLDGSYLNLECE